MSCPNIKSVCSTHEPNIEIKRVLVKEIKNASTKFIDNGETINIGVIYHVCYQDYNKESVDLDIQHVNDILNKDFNKNADNFNNGSDVYTVNISKPQLLSLYKMVSYRKRYTYLRITRRIRRNRRLYRRYIRINRRRRVLNRRIDRINSRRRRINRIRQRRNRTRIRINNQRLAQYKSQKNSLGKYEKLYQDYVSKAASANLNFQHIQTVYQPLSNITSDNLNTIDNTVKINGSPAVQPDKYLNIWIVNLNNGLLGYAQFPWDNNVQTDGVVVSRYSFGRNPGYTDYNLNKTIIHEIGHWLGLYHTFQYTFAGQEGIFDNNDDGDISVAERTGDLIEDTPIQNSPTYGDPYKTPKKWPSTRHSNKKYYHMYMNYMDYTNDKNMFMFTEEQCNKVRLMINHYRSNYML